MSDLKFDNEVWQDFSTLSAWIADNFFYKHGVIWYRGKTKKIYLYKEERTLVALFIETLFWKFLKTGQTKFNAKNILEILTPLLGMKGYENSTDVNITCRAFAEKLPTFIERIKSGDGHVDIGY